MLVVFSVGAVLLPTGAARAETDFLGPMPIADQGFGILTDTAWIVSEFTATSGQTVSAGTVIVSLDPATSAPNEIVLYSGADEASANWPVLGTLSQSAFEPAPDIAVNRWRVGFSGSIDLPAGIYFVGVRALGPGGGLDMILGKGVQSSEWVYTDTAGDFKAFVTLDSGASWGVNNFPSVGMITLAGTRRASASSDGPPAALQQVGVPATGSCADVDDRDLAWGTTASGGWGRSWAEWRAGPVCSRTLEFVNGDWRVT